MSISQVVAIDEHALFGIMRAWYGPLAQLVEHRTFNPMVDGSNPSRPTSDSFIFRLDSH
jgi:hypothetical protein